MSPSQTVLSGDEEEKEEVDKAEVVEEPPEMGTEDPVSTSQTVNLKVHPNSNISMHIPHAPYGTLTIEEVWRRMQEDGSLFEERKVSYIL